MSENLWYRRNAEPEYEGQVHARRGESVCINSHWVTPAELRAQWQQTETPDIEESWVKAK